MSNRMKGLIWSLQAVFFVMIFLFSISSVSAFTLLDDFSTDTTGDYGLKLNYTYNSAGNVTLDASGSSSAFLLYNNLSYVSGTNVSAEYTAVSFFGGIDSWLGLCVECNQTGVRLSGFSGGFRQDGGGSWYVSIVNNLVALVSDSAMTTSPISTRWRSVMASNTANNTFYLKMWPYDISEPVGWNITYVYATGPSIAGSAWGVGIPSGGVVDLHCLGYNVTEWCEFAPDVPTLDIRIQDVYDDANLEGLNVTLANGVSNLTQSDGVAHFENYTTQSFNVTDPSGLYFDYNSSTNPTENTTSTYKVFGAFVNLSAYDVFNQAVSVFNVSSGLQSNVSVGASTLLYLRPNASNVVLFEKGGWFAVNQSVNTSAKDLGSYNTSLMHDNEFFFNASDIFSNVSISSFSISAVNGSFSDVLSTSGGNVTFSLLQGYEYLFVINASGFGLSNVSLSANASNNFYEFELFAENSVLLRFFDEVSNASITQNVSVEYSDGSLFFSNSSVSGSLFVQNLPVGAWTFDVSSSGYDDRQYFVSVSSQSSQVLDVYLLNASTGFFTTFTIKDANTADVIVGSVVTMQQRVGSTWVSIDQKVSDAFGIATFSLVEGKEYRFMIETDGYFTKVGEFTNINVNYIVPLTSENSQSFTSFLNDFTFSTTPDGVVGLNETLFYLTVSSPDGVLEWFGLVVEVNGSQYSSNVTSSVSGGSAFVSLNLSSFTGQVVSASYFIKSGNFDEVFTVYDSWLLYNLSEQGNYTFSSFMNFYGEEDNGLSLGLRVFILVVVASLVAISVGLFAGFEAAVVVSSIVFLVGGLYGWLNMSVTIVVVSLLLGLLFVGGRR